MSQVSSVAYEKICNFCESYIAETERYVTIRWNKHCKKDKNSETAKQI